MKMEVRLAAVVLLAGAAGVACGDDPKAAALPTLSEAGAAGSSPTITCGPGTRLEGTQCVVEAGAAGGGGVGGITCGPGTRLEGSQCVVDEGVAGAGGAAGSGGQAGATAGAAGEGGAGGAGGTEPTLVELCRAFCQQGVDLGCPLGDCLRGCGRELGLGDCEAEGMAYLSCIIDQELTECNDGNIQVTDPGPCAVEEASYLSCVQPGGAGAGGGGG